ncbi:hypothetical protein NE237_022940 [Protea cynaroides]|uniref:N-acyl-aliphatic-L-amino acid amidohydrolase n=1 Tax=Protea cynaroides TaxID=273540 RepID=A0A9Q0K4N9_9MAGN|nr:hypothetical protein NE237_022940 [Protea cynaroides]
MAGFYGTCVLSFVPFFLIFLLFFFTSVVVSLPVDSSAIISRFQQYLQINTAQPNPDYFGAADFIFSQAKTIGLESESIEFVKGKPVVILKWSGTNPDVPSILLNSHMDVVAAEHHKWIHPPFDAHIDQAGDIYARGSQDMKCVGMQYLEAIRRLKNSGIQPVRTLYVSFVPDEEIGSDDGAEKFAESEEFEKMNVGIVLDEGLASTNENYRVFFGERCPWWVVIKATGSPGHGAKLYDNSAMENLLKSMESVRRFRAAQFDMVKAGLKEVGEVISVNMVFLKAGTPSPTGFVMNLQPSEAEAGLDIRVPRFADEKLVEKLIEEEWAPSSRNMTFKIIHKVPSLNQFGKPVHTATDGSNPWWSLLEGAVNKANGKLGKPEIFPASTDARYFRQRGLPAIGFSPMTNTPVLLHDHNEFLNQAEYLKGIEIYELIIKAYTSYTEHTRNDVSRDELPKPSASNHNPLNSLRASLLFSSSGPAGDIYARGSQDMKCVGMQYLEAIRRLKNSGFQPVRTLYVSFVPEEEIGGYDGAEKFANSEEFEKMNVGILLDEGLASPNENYSVFLAERSPWWLVIKATGSPGHGAKLYDNSAMENLLKSIDIVRRFRAAQFDMVKAGLKAEGEVISVNMAFLKAGTPSPTGFVMNLQPSEAEAGFDIRVPPTVDEKSLEKRIEEEWAPSSRGMTFEFKQKGSTLNQFGRPMLAAADGSNPWWVLLEGAVKKANGKLGKPEVYPASTDARYFRQRGLPAIGFSPMANTPILLHDHNEFLNQVEYLKGIEIYESIIKAYTSYTKHTRNDASRDELGSL